MADKTEESQQNQGWYNQTECMQFPSLKVTHPEWIPHLFSRG